MNIFSKFFEKNTVEPTYFIDKVITRIRVTDEPNVWFNEEMFDTIDGQAIIYLEDGEKVYATIPYRFYNKENAERLMNFPKTRVKKARRVNNLINKWMGIYWNNDEFIELTSENGMVFRLYLNSLTLKQ